MEAHTLDAYELEQQRVTSHQMGERPTICLVTPVYNPPLAALRAAIESVRAQTYDQWELCLADGASDRAGVRELLEEYARLDPRIRVSRLERNLGISGNSNEAARMATGEFLMIFDHDDLLAPNALFEIANPVNTHPDADLIYYDEDMISVDGTRRFHPLMKPEWSPEMLLSANYLMHCAIRRELFWSVGGFNPDFDGAQDWDLEFRCIERTSNIVHVPKVIYHWRAVSGSAAASFNAKPYVFERQLRSVTDHLQRQGIAGATARFVGPGLFRVSWPTRGSSVSIIIPSQHKHGGASPSQTTADTLFAATKYPNVEIVLVASGKSSTLPDDSRIHVVELGGECGYTTACNAGAQQATGDILLFLRDHMTPLDPDWLEEMVRWAERPEIGVVGAKILDTHHRIQHAGLMPGLGGAAGYIFQGAREREGGPFGNVDWYRNYTAVSGACLMIRREVFDRIGGFGKADEDDDVEQSSVELCQRVLAMGYRNLYTPYARLATRTRRPSATPTSNASNAPMRDRHHGAQILTIADDRYFNPNLSRTELIPNMATPKPSSRQ